MRPDETSKECPQYRRRVWVVEGLAIGNIYKTYRSQIFENMVPSYVFEISHWYVWETFVQLNSFEIKYGMRHESWDEVVVQVPNDTSRSVIQ